MDFRAFHMDWTLNQDRTDLCSAALGSFHPDHKALALESRMDSSLSGGCTGFRTGHMGS